jgi:hypothetical protein
MQNDLHQVHTSSLIPVFPIKAAYINTNTLCLAQLFYHGLCLPVIHFIPGERPWQDFHHSFESIPERYVHLVFIL